MLTLPFQKLKQHNCFFCEKWFDRAISVELHIEHRHQLSNLFMVELLEMKETKQPTKSQKKKKLRKKLQATKRCDKKKKRLSPKYYTAMEDYCLRLGILKYQKKFPLHIQKKGIKGIWSSIKEDPQFSEQLKSRTPQQLRCRFRVWLKNDTCVFVKDRLIFKVIPKRQKRNTRNKFFH